MKKVLVLILLLVVLIIATAPAGAMIGGEEDDEHTNVGAIVFRGPDDLGRICTGILIDPQVVVTAAHCTEPLFDNGLVPDYVWVTFEQDALFGDPAQDPEYLAIERIVEHVADDIALIFLSEPVQGITPQALPSEGYLDQVVDQLPPGNALGELDVIFVGYGGTENLGLPDNLFANAARRVGNTTVKKLKPLEITTDNVDTDDAVICDGDSGGPLFHVDDQGNETMVGIQSKSGSNMISCDLRGHAIKYRLDTERALAFINDNLP